MKKQLKNLSLLMALVMVIGAALSIVGFANDQSETTAITPDTSWYDQNSKTKTATLRDAADLAGLSAICTETTQFLYGWTIKLGDDIVYNTGNAADFATTAPINVWTPVAEFWGTFDGQGYVVSGLYVKDATKTHIGLFGIINGATVKNVSVVNSYFEGKTKMGGIVGEAKELTCTISNCYSDAIISSNPATHDGAYCGGIVGYITAPTSLVENCWFAGSITAASEDNDNYGTRCGGIVGNTQHETEASTIKNCLVTGSITAQTQLGGILGAAREKGTTGTVIENCLMLGTMRATRDNASLFFGQFAGVWKNGYKISLNNVYGLDTFEVTVDCETFTADKKASLYNVGGSGVVVADSSAKITLASITGDTAKTTLSNFDFDGEDAIWATVADGTPVIKALAYIAANKASGLDPAPADPVEDDNTNNENNGEGGNNTTDTDSTDETKVTETNADADKNADVTTDATTDATEKTKGCGSSLMGAGAVILVASLGVVFAGKKRD